MLIVDESFVVKEPVIVSIGKFDGDHIGHQKIFEKMREISVKKNLKTLVFTFDNFSCYGESGKKINSKIEKYSRLENEKIDYLVEYKFSDDLKSMTGEDFLMKILIEKLNMKVLVAGEDLSFGNEKSGNIELINKYSRDLNIEIYIIKKEKTQDDKEISSTLIRNFILLGRIKEANELMGYEYSISGIVESGNKIGKKMFNVPTANIYPDNDKILPLYGVYKTHVEIVDTKEKFLAITNVGVNPSIEFDKNSHLVRIENYILDFDRNLYGQKIKVYFKDFIRQEKKFRNTDELKEQIKKDIDTLKTKTKGGKNEINK